MLNVSLSIDDKEHFRESVLNGYDDASGLGKFVTELEMDANNEDTVCLDLIEDYQMVVSNDTDRIDWDNFTTAAESIGGVIARTVDCKILGELSKVVVPDSLSFGNTAEPITSEILLNARSALVNGNDSGDNLYCVAIPAVWYTSLLDIIDHITGVFRFPENTECVLLSHILLDGANLGGENVGFVFSRSSIELSISKQICTNLFIEPVYGELVGSGKRYAAAHISDISGIAKIQGFDKTD